MSYHHCDHCGTDTTYDLDSEEGAYCINGCTDLCECGHPMSQHDSGEVWRCTGLDYSSGAAVACECPAPAEEGGRPCLR